MTSRSRVSQVSWTGEPPQRYHPKRRGRRATPCGLYEWTAEAIRVTVEASGPLADRRPLAGVGSKPVTWQVGSPGWGRHDRLGAIAFEAELNRVMQDQQR